MAPPNTANACSTPRSTNAKTMASETLSVVGPGLEAAALRAGTTMLLGGIRPTFASSLCVGAEVVARLSSRCCAIASLERDAVLASADPHPIDASGAKLRGAPIVSSRTRGDGALIMTGQYGRIGPSTSTPTWQDGHSWQHPRLRCGGGSDGKGRQRAGAPPPSARLAPWSTHAMCSRLRGLRASRLPATMRTGLPCIGCTASRRTMLLMRGK